MRHAIIILAAAALGACTAGPGAGSKQPSASIPRVSLPVRTGPQPAQPASNQPPSAQPAPAQPNARRPSRTPSVMQEDGLEAIIGKPAPALTAQFGKARLDGTEGDVRKLQFVSETCVLDIYLYPVGQNAAPVATHVEAREPTQGAVMDRSSCAAQIARQAQR